MTEPAATPAPSAKGGSASRKAALLAGAAVLALAGIGAAVIHQGVVRFDTAAFQGQAPGEVAAADDTFHSEDAIVGERPQASPAIRQARADFAPAAPDPFAELRKLAAEASAPAAADEADAGGRAERERQSAALRDLGLLLRQGLEAQIALRREVGRLEGEHRAAMEGVQQRVDALNMRVAFAAEARATATVPPLVPAVAEVPASPAVAQNAAATGVQPQRAPWQTLGHVPPRSLRSPASAYQVSDAWSDMALLNVVKRGGERPGHILVKVGTPVPGLGRVTKIERRGTGWEVHGEHGIVTQ